MLALAERILAGEEVCKHEVWEDNAARIHAREDHREAKGPHDPAKCRKANCTHGLGSDRWYAAELIERAKRDCTCGARK